MRIVRSRRMRSALIGTVVGLLLAAVPFTPARADTAGTCWDTTIQGVRAHVCHGWQWLDEGQSWYFGNSRMTMQSDGNLVIYNTRNGKAAWSTKTHGLPASARMKMRFNHHGWMWLEAWYGEVNDIPWSSPQANCAADRRAVLALQADSNFVVYCHKTGSYQYKWASHTVY